MDIARREASWRSTPFELTAIQFELLRVLMGSPGRVFSRDELLNQVWGYDYYGDTRTVDSAVKRLRARLREVASDAELIVTVRDAGYKLSDDQTPDRSWRPAGVELTMFNRLTTRLILSHLLVIAVAMALLSFVLLSLVQGYFLQATQQSLTIQARLTAQALMSSQGITLTNIMQTILPSASNVLQQQQFSQLSVQVQNTRQIFRTGRLDYPVERRVWQRASA